jgi:predicted deacylase
MSSTVADEITLFSQAFARQVEISRVLGEIGSGSGPTIVVTAGLHGNEPAGIFAFIDFLEELRTNSPPLKGKVIGLAGNLAALQKGVRFIDADLNRLWRSETVQSNGCQSGQPASEPCSELRELRELYAEIKRILATESGPFYFVDLHTTSSVSPPFIPFDDTLSNREFIRRFPVPGILGIEEYLPGTLLSYLLRYGVVAFGYEAGRHDDPRSVEFHRAMLALCLERAGCLDRSYVPQWTQKEELLKSGTKDVGGFYEIRFRYLIDPDEQFSMLPGFKSFQPIHRNQTVAKNKRGQIAARESGQIFMPLYQSQGAEGFFIVRPVHRFWLELSRFLRHWKFDRLLALLPGVRLTEGELQMLVVDRRIARFLTRQVFHLLGYRRHSQEGPVVRFARREK